MAIDGVETTARYTQLAPKSVMLPGVKIADNPEEDMDTTPEMSVA